jgi:hypothetical protein
LIYASGDVIQIDIILLVDHPARQPIDLHIDRTVGHPETRAANISSKYEQNT